MTDDMLEHFRGYLDGLSARQIAEIAVALLTEIDAGNPNLAKVLCRQIAGDHVLAAFRRDIDSWSELERSERAELDRIDCAEQEPHAG